MLTNINTYNKSVISVTIHAVRFNPNFKLNHVSVLCRVLPDARVLADRVEGPLPTGATSPRLRAASADGAAPGAVATQAPARTHPPRPRPHQPGGAVGAGAGLALHPRPGPSGRAPPAGPSRAPTAAPFERAARLPIGRGGRCT